MSAGELPGLVKRFAGLVGGVPGRLAGFVGGVAGFAGGVAGFAGGVVGFDGGLTGYVRFAVFAPQGCPFHEALQLESDVLLGLGGLPCWCPGSMRLIASSQYMMLSGTQDGKGSGSGEVVKVL